VFYPAVGVVRSELEPRILGFYRDDFPRLRGLTETRPEAAGLLAWARRRDLSVVIATNPLFPRIAIDHRIRWAGIDPDDDVICLITSAENMHATKARPAYYREILERVGHHPHDCLMVGDDWEWDIVQAGRLGIPAWWIADTNAVPPDSHGHPVGQGDLAACGRWLDRLR
jgi:FMN phosphatase YigB (HAD superfamily)